MKNINEPTWSNSRKIHVTPEEANNFYVPYKTLKWIIELDIYLATNHVDGLTIAINLQYQAYIR